MTQSQLFVLSSAATVHKSPVLSSPTLALIYKDDVVLGTGDKRQDGSTTFLEVEYRPNKTGWVYSALLDTYVEESEYVVPIPDELRTPERDAEQYILWEGLKKTNLCGAFCVAHLAQQDIKSFLLNYKIYSPSNYQSNVVQNKPIGISVLRVLTNMAELETMELKVFFTDKVVGEIYSINGFIKGLRDGYKPILGVKIDYNGKLGSRIGHWVVLEDIEPIRNGDGIVKIYNSFSNRMQKYSYSELVKSMNSFGGYTGLWIRPKGKQMKSEIELFCEKKNISEKMSDAFIAYVRSINASKFDFRKDGDTNKLTVARMTEEQVNEIWQQFILDLRSILPKELI